MAPFGPRSSMQDPKGGKPAKDTPPIRRNAAENAVQIKYPGSALTRKFHEVFSESGSKESISFNYLKVRCIQAAYNMSH